MNEMIPLMRAVENQVDLLMSMATFGFGGVLFVFLRTGGLVDDTGAIAKFKLLGFLSTPIILFFLSLFAGLMAVSQIQGFFQEVALNGEAFRKFGSSPQALYDAQYKVMLGATMVVQMGLAVIGYAAFLIWFFVNMYNHNKQQKG